MKVDELDFDAGVVEDAVIVMQQWAIELENTNYGSWPRPRGEHLLAVEALIGIARQVLAAVLAGEVGNDESV